MGVIETEDYESCVKLKRHMIPLLHEMSKYVVDSVKESTFQSLVQFSTSPWVKLFRQLFE